MAVYKVRPYFGYDCNSECGFNNGHYLDEMLIEAQSAEDAAQAALELFCKQVDPSESWEQDSNFGDFNLYREYDHHLNGEPITREQLADLEDTDGVSYLYQYIDFSADVTGTYDGESEA